VRRRVDWGLWVAAAGAVSLAVPRAPTPEAADGVPARCGPVPFTQADEAAALGSAVECEEHRGW
jgi:hypothetical protein